MKIIIWNLMMGGIIGWIGGIITSKKVPGGVIGNVLAGLIGAWFGGIFFGEFGPVINGFVIIPALLGATILVVIISSMMRPQS